MYRLRRTCARPPTIIRRPRKAPLSRATGAKPARADLLRRARAEAGTARRAEGEARGAAEPLSRGQHELPAAAVPLGADRPIVRRFPLIRHTVAVESFFDTRSRLA